ncbi:MAG: hypothetical protein H0V24_07095 [Chloroflexia bacterium]|nr:hypothetical protein [Chloroflexia bacterium]
MDGSRFDGITRALATGQTRRHALLGAAGSAIAGLLGLAGVEDVAAAWVKPGKKGGDGPKNKKCCDGATCKGGNNDKEGKGECKGRLKQCGDKCVNLRNDKKCEGSNKCKNSKCRSTLGCKVGQNICGGPPTVPNDPRIRGGDLVKSVCLCVTDVEGAARCSDLVGGTCSDCTSNADRDPGFVCIDGRGPNCNCELQPESNGNARVQGNCDGLTGSSADRGRTRLTTPLLR